MKRTPEKVWLLYFMPDCLADIPLGCPDGELSASMRYLAQRYTMPYRECMATLTDIGTEELAHLEMICAIVYQLTKNMTMDQLGCFSASSTWTFFSSSFFFPRNGPPDAVRRIFFS